MRALYQRSKGRDLFDLWYALETSDLEDEVILRCFGRYLTEGGHSVSRAKLEANLLEKAGDRDFREDVVPLLRPGVDWSFDGALATVVERLVDRLGREP